VKSYEIQDLKIALPLIPKKIYKCSQNKKEQYVEKTRVPKRTYLK
jgi:hypothetical protein